MSLRRREALLAACRRVEATVRARPEYGHTSRVHVRVAGEVVYDVHLRGPEVADSFSVTKTVVATLVGIAVREGLVRDLDETLDDLLGLRGTPSQGQTWRHLLTMMRGSCVDRPYDLDTVMALPAGWAERIVAAPRVHPPGRVFRYDNGGFYLLGVALAERAGTSLAAFAEEALSAPLGIRDACWLRGPDGYDVGCAHLRVRAQDLGVLGDLWLAGGTWGGRRLVDAGVAEAMTTADNGGGPPEDHPYGLGVWIAPEGFFSAGWAGQLVLAVPAAEAVVVVTGDPRFELGPPPTDELPPGWRPAAELVREHVIPALLGR